jgi:hypothetical protein
MSLLALSGTNSAVAGGYDIENSLKLEKSNNEHLYRAMVDGNRKTWTFSCWIKRTELLQINSQALIHFGVNHQVTRMFIDDTNDQIYLDVCNTANELYRSITNRRFRDTSAWYHIVWRMDTTQSTAANRMRLYINGVEETSWSQHQIPPQNYETLANTTAGGYDDMGIGTFVWAGSTYDGLFSGYLAQVAHVDGQSYAPTEFGEFDEDSGIWKPKDVSDLNYGTGNNSFFLDFETASDLGANAKGNDVNFSLNNITSADQATDTPTKNFCTFNPLMYQNNKPTISEGAMKSAGVGGAWSQTWGNIGVKNGKWYYEFKVANTSSTGYFGASTTPAEGSSTAAGTVMYNTSFMLGQSPRIDYYYWQNGSLAANESTGWGTISTNDVIGIALDLDSATKTFTAYKNGTALSGTLSQPVALPTNMQDEFIFPLYVQYNDRQDEANFGGYTISSISTPASDENGYGNFEYAPPSGYYALCTKNLAEYG